MRFLSLEKLRHGMAIARPVYGESGVLLLKEGSTLSINNIVALRNIGYPGIYIFDEHTKSIKIELVVDEAKRANATKIVKDMFNTTKSKKENYLEMNTAISQIMDQMVDEIFAADSAALNIPLLKSFDEYTYQHSVDVAILAIILGRGLKLPKETVIKLSRSAFLHDIGKMFIPKNILNKKGKLTMQEFNLMKKHPELGYDFAKEILAESDEILEGILFHHEHFSGGGYPYNISGKDIPYFARIITVADVFDALTSKRTYRSDISIQEAYENIMASSQVHFDPDIVEVFCRTVAPFPLGVEIELSDGRRAIVIKNNTEFMMRPLVKILRGDNREEYIDLAADLAALSLTIISNRSAG